MNQYELKKLLLWKYFYVLYYILHSILLFYILHNPKISAHSFINVGWYAVGVTQYILCI